MRIGGIACLSVCLFTRAFVGLFPLACCVRTVFVFGFVLRVVCCVLHSVVLFANYCFEGAQFVACCLQVALLAERSKGFFSKREDDSNGKCFLRTGV